MGKAALEGRPGVEKVTNGWRGNREVNTVWYDPDITDVHALERILRGSGTYLGTLEPEPESGP